MNTYLYIYMYVYAWTYADVCMYVRHYSNNIYPLPRTTGTRARVAADGWKNAAMSWPLDNTSFEIPR
jgi:hypothetical protein